MYFLRENIIKVKLGIEKVTVINSYQLKGSFKCIGEMFTIAYLKPYRNKYFYSKLKILITGLKVTY